MTADMPKRRPGPFGPAMALLPSGQEVLLIPDSTKAWDALERMIDADFSQVPVTDEHGKVTGVFSWQSFGKRVLDLRGNRIDATELCVRDCMEDAVFISPDTYIDTDSATDWSQVDYVLVGRPDEVIGVLTVSDVFGRLNDFAEAFVVLYEIELDLREIIKELLSVEQLAAVYEQFTQPNTPPVRDLHDLSFSHYLTIICARDRWPIFEPLFVSPRELIHADMKQVNELRNVVFHFRRQITPRDTDRMQRFRDKLRLGWQQHRRRAAKESA
ncbi:MAG: CBS domain-containing protein [Phycisphaerales bacterium]|nr:CBS domain-containing protein [Phycisphaerales bacterium]